MAEDEDREEVITCEDHDLNEDRGFVIRFAGAVIVSCIPLYLVLSFLEALVNHKAWAPNDQVIAVIVGTASVIGYFAWRSKKK